MVSQGLYRLFTDYFYYIMPIRMAFSLFPLDTVHHITLLSECIVYTFSGYNNICNLCEQLKVNFMYSLFTTLFRNYVLLHVYTN